MVKHSAIAAVAAHLIGLAAAGTTVWSGSFDDMSVATLEDWSWSNQVGEYQWYIYGTGNTSDYVAFDSTYANPDDGSVTQGAKISLTSTSYWEGQTMRRTELIPQASDTSAISSGTLYYHFSIMRQDTNAPSTAREHQIAFFESHFTELQYGLASGGSGSGDTTLKWMANSAEQWNATMEAGVWHNCVYEIDFDAGTVAFWHSTGGDELTQVVSAVTASASSNGADWHVGVLELPVTGVADADEDFYFSGVYIESGDLTTTFGAGSGSSSSGSSSVASSAAASSTVAATTSAAVVASSSVASSSSVAPVASSSSSSAAVAVASAPSSVAETSSAAAATSAAPVTTSLAATSSACKKTKTVWVTASA
ncbi:hypothetical protein N0V93_001983 [Gnomoniopsis smithogilvyi]|uniref:Glycoside hydrolase 131 catalytic N-terminal domain-containing protein n=1 Tax=Gnomoniopsis smithogilvyi TaxID=1191159 RepID=A0A9W8Z500_9PEZI|nr:hypothetical protein N0V93_001983 [Gnomoniopsis smithogilvyi]